MENNPSLSVIDLKEEVSSLISEKEKIEQIADHFRSILLTLGLDLNDPSIEKTPNRVAKMYVQEIFSGLNSDTFPKITFVKNSEDINYQNPVFVKVKFVSFCEHHFVPIDGFAYISYIPNRKIIGLSKIPRIVKYFARKPQLQERLTIEIHNCLCELLETKNVAVFINAKHYCVIARGVEDQSSLMTTTQLSGDFEAKENIRQSFFASVNHRGI